MPKKGCLGFSLPVLAGVLFVFLLLLVIGFIIGPLGKSMFGDLGLPAWLSVPQPKPELPAEEVFQLFGFPITNSVIGAWITIIVLVGFSYVITRRMKVVPGRLQSAFELLLGWLYNLCQRVAGEENGRRFFPIVATIFLFVAFNAALALVSFIFVEYFGLKSLGVRYLGKFINVGQFFRGVGHIARGSLRTGFSGLITGLIHIFVGFLEALSELVRIVSFTFRLFGNMTAGEILLLIAAFLVPWVFALPFYGLELLVGFVQALIFSGLTLVFLTLAVSHHGGEAA